MLSRSSLGRVEGLLICVFSEGPFLFSQGRLSQVVLQCAGLFSVAQLSSNLTIKFNSTLNSQTRTPGGQTASFIPFLWPSRSAKAAARQLFRPRSRSPLPPLPPPRTCTGLRRRGRTRRSRPPCRRRLPRCGGCRLLPRSRNHRTTTGKKINIDNLTLISGSETLALRRHK